MVVRTRMLFGATSDRTRSKAEAAATYLNQALKNVPMVSAVLVYDDLLGEPPPECHVRDGGYRLSTGWMDGCARAALLVPNPIATTPLSEAEIEGLVGPKMRW